MKAVIIGAGLAGPAAALGLAKQGHDVTVVERRTPNDLWSDSTIAVTSANMRLLEAFGVTVDSLPPGSLAVNVDVTSDEGMITTTSDWTTRFHIVVWGGMHQALVDHGEKAGVEYLWRQNGKIPPADLVVHAQGVRYAAHHSEFTYAYRVYRGTLFGDAAPRWVSVHDSEKRFVLNIGSTGTQQTWMFYVHEPEGGDLRTDIVVGERRRDLMAKAYSLIPEPYASVVTSTRSEIQSSPVGDWTMPRTMHWNGADYDDPSHVFHVDIGDAVVPVRPHTTAGANLGIAEALSLPLARNFAHWEGAAKLLRQREIDRGGELGMQWMGR